MAQRQRPPPCAIHSLPPPWCSCAEVQDTLNVCGCKAAGEEVSAWGPVSCCAGLSVVSSGGKDYCGCLPIGAPTNAAANCCTEEISSGACACIPDGKAGSDFRIGDCCSGATTNDLGGNTWCWCWPAGAPTRLENDDYLMCCSKQYTGVGKDMVCI